MTPNSPPTEELARLLEACCLGEMQSDEAERLRELVCNDAESRVHYLFFMQMHAMMERRAGSAKDVFTVESQGNSVSAPPALVTPHPALPGAIGFFSSDWTMAYFVATIVFVIGLGLAYLMPVGQPVQIANERAIPGAFDRSVARITDMADCRWGKKGLGIRDWGLEEDTRFKVQGSRFNNFQSPTSKSLNPQIPKSLVFLGDQFILTAGLMEITYNTGARVILQGPCTYEVDSADGGFLEIGKLTARVEQRGERRGEGGGPRSKVQGSRQENLQTSKSPNPEIPKSPNPQLTTNHYPLFTIKTPTAVITDLGTEFGIEVGAEGGERVWVFQGKVKVCTSKGQTPGEITLAEGQSVSIDPGGALAKGRIDKSTLSGAPLIRQMPKPDGPAFVSLADLVAGGNGFRNRSLWGIDPRDGQVVIQHFGSEISSGGAFQLFNIAPQIDGVFVPNAVAGPTQVDSAGHVFEFPYASGVSCGPIWVTKGEEWIGPPAQPQQVMRLHANVGITFDLDAIRASVSGRRLANFSTTIAYHPQMEFNPKNHADAWVLIDGHLRFSRRNLCDANGLVAVDIPIQDTDRFLTLVSTEGDDGTGQDHVQWLDPRVVLEQPTGAETKTELMR